MGLSNETLVQDCIRHWVSPLIYVSFIPYLSFGFWYFGQLRDFLSSFFRLAHLPLQNVNKDYVIFLYFHNFVAQSDQKPKMKNGMNETLVKNNGPWIF